MFCWKFNDFDIIYIFFIGAGKCQPEPIGKLQLQPGQVAATDKRLGNDTTDVLQHDDSATHRNDAHSAPYTPPARQYDSASQPPNDPEPKRTEPGQLAVGDSPKLATVTGNELFIFWYWFGWICTC